MRVMGKDLQADAKMRCGLRRSELVRHCKGGLVYSLSWPGSQPSGCLEVLSSVFVQETLRLQAERKQASSKEETRSAFNWS